MSSVVVGGSCNGDLVVRTARHPAPGETVLGSDVATHPGGKGANQAVAAARAGASVAMVGRLGSDSGADVLRAEMTRAGIDVSSVGTCAHDPTGTALITVSESGENTIVVVPGANAMLRPMHVDDALAAGVFADARVVLVQLEIEMQTVVSALRTAKLVGARTILNAAPSVGLPDGVLDLVDILVVNESEFASVVGGHASLDPSMWPPLGAVSTIVLTLGADGVVFGPPGGSEAVSTSAVIARGSLPGFRIAVVDTTAAGDTFCGYMASGLAGGLSLAEACSLANAAAALACTRAGAQPSIPFVDDVVSFMAGTPR